MVAGSLTSMEYIEPKGLQLGWKKTQVLIESKRLTYNIWVVLNGYINLPLHNRFGECY